MRFKAKVELGGKTATGFEVPGEGRDRVGPVAEARGARHDQRAHVPEHGRDDGRPVHGGVSAENREKAGVAAGDRVDVEIELDTEPRVLEVPPDFAKALEGGTGAKKFYNGLSFSKQRRFVDPIGRRRRRRRAPAASSKAIDDLRAGKGVSAGLARNLAPGDALVGAGFAGQAEHTLADDVLHHLVGAARDVTRGRAERSPASSAARPRWRSVPRSPS